MIKPRNFTCSALSADHRELPVGPRGIEAHAHQGDTAQALSVEEVFVDPLLLDVISHVRSTGTHPYEPQLRCHQPKLLRDAVRSSCTDGIGRGRSELEAARTIRPASFPQADHEARLIAQVPHVHGIRHALPLEPTPVPGTTALRIHTLRHLVRCSNVENGQGGDRRGHRMPIEEARVERPLLPAHMHSG